MQQETLKGTISGKTFTFLSTSHCEFWINPGNSIFNIDPELTTSHQVHDYHTDPSHERLLQWPLNWSFCLHFCAPCRLLPTVARVLPQPRPSSDFQKALALLAHRPYLLLVPSHGSFLLSLERAHCSFPPASELGVIWRVLQSVPLPVYFCPNVISSENPTIIRLFNMAPSTTL